MSSELRFPRGFLWGAATSAFQIEGAVREDGRGESIWDTFCRVPGAVRGGETADVASDHYHRWADDVALIAELGLRAYRFSIAWPRIVPDGLAATRTNERGLAFYDRLVDALLERGVTPLPTLYHWDLPQALQDRGGWPARDTAYRFADYADRVSRALGDRVSRWITHNEPWCAAFLGHLRGVHAPGTKDLGAALLAAHHILLSHGLAVQALRATQRASRIGITLSLFPTYPRTDSEADREAARLSDGYTNRWFLDPVHRGAYPADTAEHFAKLGAALDFVEPGDLATIAAPTDFVGVNYYHRRVIDASPGHDLGWTVIDRSPGVPTTDLGWEIVPDCFTDLLLRLERDYGPRRPILITENGAVFRDEIAPDGAVHDPKRVAFLRAHLAAMHRAISEGANVEGYLCWTLIDNFEWAFGTGERFGIVYVDYETQRRIPKDSARFLSAVARADALAVE